MVQLAKKHHPDLCRSADSQPYFTKLQIAYKVLSDTEKRAQYDRYELFTMFFLLLVCAFQCLQSSVLMSYMSSFICPHLSVLSWGSASQHISPVFLFPLFVCWFWWTLYVSVKQWFWVITMSLRTVVVNYEIIRNSHINPVFYGSCLIWNEGKWENLSTTIWITVASII